MTIEELKKWWPLLVMAAAVIVMLVFERHDPSSWPWIFLLGAGAAIYWNRHRDTETPHDDTTQNEDTEDPA